MQEVIVPEGKPLSQVERVVDTYIAPSKTFRDILRDASWWLPFVITAVVSILFAYVVLHKIGVATLVDGILRTNATLQDRLANSSPGDAARIRAGIETQFKFMYAGPVFGIIIGLIASAIFLATANFAFGGRARYPQMLAVWFYGTLPLLFIYLLTIITAYAGMTGDSFNIKNTIGANVGYYLQGGSTPNWLVTLLSSVDVFAIWSAVLLTIGVSIVSGIKRSSAAITVFGWWVLWVLIQTGIAAITG